MMMIIMKSPHEWESLREMHMSIERKPILLPTP